MTSTNHSRKKAVWGRTTVIAPSSPSATKPGANSTMSRTSHAVVFAGLVFCLASSIACDESLRDIAGPTPDLQPTLSSIQKSVFNTGDAARASCTQCHTDAGRTPSMGLNLAPGKSHAAIVGQPSRGKPGAILVVPGDPDNSYFVKKMEGTTDIAGGQMPRGGPHLTAGQLRIIRRWIELGAKND
jgi:hypothetical protein